jgi:hypothetical protein
MMSLKRNITKTGFGFGVRLELRHLEVLCKK